MTGVDYSIIDGRQYIHHLPAADREVFVSAFADGESPNLSVRLEQVLDAVFHNSPLDHQPDRPRVFRCELPLRGIGPYPIHPEAVTCLFAKESGGLVRCGFPEFDHLPQGTGKTAREACNSLKRQIHFAFQRLAALEDFERDETDQALWDQLTRLIDVERYETQRVIARRAVGQVVKLPADAGVQEASSGDSDWRVRWHADDREEAVALEQVPLEFGRLRPSQWFEALVERDASTGGLRRIVHIQVRRPPLRLTDEELQRHLADRRHPGQTPADPTP